MLLAAVTFTEVVLSGEVLPVRVPFAAVLFLLTLSDTVLFTLTLLADCLCGALFRDAEDEALLLRPRFPMPSRLSIADADASLASILDIALPTALLVPKLHSTRYVPSVLCPKSLKVGDGFFSDEAYARSFAR